MTSVPIARQPVAVLGDVVAGTRLRDLALVVGGAAAVGVAAQLSVPLPFTPVPLTGQTFAVLVVGAALGWRRAASAMALYLLAGVAGMPWFSGGSSGAVGASLGYIVGFVPAAAVVGRLAGAQADRTPLRTVGMMMAGSAVGVPWLATSVHVGTSKAIAPGLTPFLVGDVIKAALAAALLPGAWRVATWAGRV